MIKEISLPLLGENIKGADVAAVLIEPGDIVTRDQPVLELESEKAFMEFPSPDNGTIKEVKIHPGDKIITGQLMFIMETENADADVSEADAAADKEEVDTNISTDKINLITNGKKPPIQPDNDSSGEIAAPPSSYRLARELGLDLESVKGSGPDGLITHEDMIAYSRKRHRKDVNGEHEESHTQAAIDPPMDDVDHWGPVHRESMSAVRTATAQQMELCWKTIPHVTQFREADITDIEKFRKSITTHKISLTSILTKISALAMLHHKKFNASIDMQNQIIMYRDYIHIGVAVDTGRGLLVPVIRDVDKKGIADIDAEIRQLADRARDKKLHLDEMQGAGFTITNLGGLGTGHFTPIINWPQVAILGIGKAKYRPVYQVNDRNNFTTRFILPLSITYDHRLIDGADGSRFLNWITNALENPFSVLL